MADLLTRPFSSSSVYAAGGALLPALVINDMDDAGDVDDNVVKSVLRTAEKRGLVKQLGTVISSSLDTSAPAARAFYDRYGQTEHPVYAYPGANGTYNNTYSAAFRNQWGVYNQTRAAFQSDIVGYRTMLNNAPDGSVVIFLNGGFTSISRLIDSPADGIVNLNGIQLMQKKVKYVLAFGGQFPSASFAEYNISRDIPASQNFANNCPVPVVWAGYEIGATTYTGPSEDADPKVDPLASSFAIAASNSVTYLAGRRNSWGPVTALYLLYGLGDTFTFGGQNGTVTVAGNGYTTWTATTGKHSYLTQIAGRQARLANQINDMVAENDLTPRVPNRSSFAFNLNEESGLRVYDKTYPDMSGLIGDALNVAGSFPARVAAPGGSGKVLDFNGSNNILRIPYRAGFGSQAVCFGMVIRPDVVTGSRQLLTREDWTTPPERVFQFFSNDGKLTFTLFDPLGAGTAYPEAGASLSAGAYCMLTVFANGTSLVIQKDGVPILTTTMSRALNDGFTRTRMLFGARINSTPAATEFFDGKLALLDYAADATSATLTAMEADLRARATAKGITIP